MTLKNKKNPGNKRRARASGASSRDDGPKESRTAVIIDLAAVRRKKTAVVEDVSPAAEGLRLVQAFLKIPDPVKRAELISMVEDYVRRAR